MIIVELAGGLGNQMFQYATARAVAARHGTQLRVDVSHFAGKQRHDELQSFRRSFKLAQFNIEAEIATPEEIAAIRDRYPARGLAGLLVRAFGRVAPINRFGRFHERSANFDPNVLRIRDNTYLRGYFQSEQYFIDAAEQVRSEFTPRDSSLADYADRYVAERRAENRPVVAVHVRRGDLAYSLEVVKNPSLVYGPVVTLEYLRAAMAAFAAERPTYIVFSDSARDLDWCRERLEGAGVHFAYEHSDLQDFAVMRACDHQIISNSTFSWWAAWLNPNPRKRVIAPRAWYFPELHPGFRMESLIPPQWTMM